MGSGPRVQSWYPHAAHLLGEEGPILGDSTELAGLQTCVKSMKDKNIKLVNVNQVMLVRRILPCQRKAFHLWEFVPAEHQTLQKLYDMTHKGAWKVLFKASEVPPHTSEDRGLHAARIPSPVSFLTTTGFGSSQYNHGGVLSNCVYLCRIMWRQRSGLTVRLRC